MLFERLRAPVTGLDDTVSLEKEKEKNLHVTTVPVGNQTNWTRAD